MLQHNLVLMFLLGIIKFTNLKSPLYVVSFHADIIIMLWQNCTHSYHYMSINLSHLFISMQSICAWYLFIHNFHSFQSFFSHLMRAVPIALKRLQIAPSQMQKSIQASYMAFTSYSGALNPSFLNSHCLRNC